MSELAGKCLLAPIICWVLVFQLEQNVIHAPKNLQSRRGDIDFDQQAHLPSKPVFSSRGAPSFDLVISRA